MPLQKKFWQKSMRRILFRMGSHLIKLRRSEWRFKPPWFSLTDRARIKEGEAVLITGATGSVGIAATQLASTWNCRVLAGLTTPSKASAARKAGADLIIDLSTDNPREDIREQVMRLTGGEGVDVVLDTIGGDVFLRCDALSAFSGAHSCCWIHQRINP